MIYYSHRSYNFIKMFLNEYIFFLILVKIHKYLYNKINNNFLVTVDYGFTKK